MFCRVEVAADRARTCLQIGFELEHVDHCRLRIIEEGVACKL
jgi:hypothetical protein